MLQTIKTMLIYIYLFNF